MLTTRQRSTLLSAALTSFRAQKAVVLNEADFDVIIDKPNSGSFCSIYLVTNRTDDHLRIKLYVTNFSMFTNVEQFRLSQEENYAPGAYDEVEVANITLDKIEFRSFYQYLISPQFQQDIITATDRIQLEDGMGFVIGETSESVTQEH
jgi:hypothetical protein